MDPELLNLFIQASNAAGGRSKVLSSLNNPLLPFLANAYSPPVDAGMGGPGSLWATYANNQDYPELQPIIQAIQGGADEIQTDEAVNRALGGNTSAGFFSDKNLHKLAAGLQKEYTGSGSTGSKSKSDVFAKAGLRNPTDVYTMADVPLPANIQSAMMRMMPGYEVASSKAARAKADYERSNRMSKKQAADIAAAFRSEGMLNNNSQGQLLRLADWIQGQSTLNPSVLEEGISKFNKPGFGYVQQPYEAGVQRVKKRLGSKLNIDTQAVDKASTDMSAAQLEADKMRSVMTSYQKGVLKAYQEMGRTPAKDQMSQILQFISKTGK